MTDPAGSDRIQQDIPTASCQDDDLPAKADSDVARAERADPPGGA